MNNFFTYHIFREHPELNAGQILNCNETKFSTNASKGKVITVKAN